MEADFCVIVKGSKPELAGYVSEALDAAIHAFEDSYSLDLRRMHRVIVTADYAAEMAELSSQTVSGKAIEFTNEDYSICVAKVLMLPSDNDIEIVPVIDTRTAETILVPISDNPDQKGFDEVLHLLHHEFCHVHDMNKKIDSLPDIMLKHVYRGKDMFIRPIADNCWDEYSANFQSSSSAKDEIVLAFVEELREAIDRTQQLVNRAILEYRTHGNMDVLLEQFRRHADYLPKAAAYVLGYMDGLDVSLNDLSPVCAEKVSDSYFQKTFHGMHQALCDIGSPEHWRTLDVFDNLAKILEQYYLLMGLEFENREDGRININVPLRPETTPDR